LLVDDAQDLAAHSYFSTALSSGGTYYWRSRAKNAAGEGPWSAVWKFSTLAGLPAAPVLISPSNDTTNMNTSAILRWTSVGGALSYDADISLKIDFIHPVDTLRTLVDAQCAVAGLDSGRTYLWRARARSAAGAGPWSAAWRFSTAAPKVSSVEMTPNRSPSIFIYPNPSSGTTMIETDAGPHARVTIVDIYGRESALQSSLPLGSSPQRFEFDASCRAAGSYYLRFIDGAQSESRVLIVRR
jgi:hypothetical protein